MPALEDPPMRGLVAVVIPDRVVLCIRDQAAPRTQGLVGLCIQGREVPRTMVLGAQPILVPVARVTRVQVDHAIQGQAEQGQVVLRYANDVWALPGSVDTYLS